MFFSWFLFFVSDALTDHDQHYLWVIMLKMDGQWDVVDEKTT